MDFNNASSSWDEPVHLMDLESSVFCELKAIHFMDLESSTFYELKVVHFMDLELSTFYELKVIHFMDLETCLSYGLHEPFSSFLGWSSLFCGLEGIYFCKLKVVHFSWTINL